MRQSKGITKHVKRLLSLIELMNKSIYETAKSNEGLFRTLLDKFNIEHKNLSINEIYKQYGRKHELTFIKTKSNEFYFSFVFNKCFRKDLRIIY